MRAINIKHNLISVVLKLYLAMIFKMDIFHWKQKNTKSRMKMLSLSLSLETVDMQRLAMRTVRK